MQSIQVREGLHHGFVIRSEGVLTEGLAEVAHNSHVAVGLRRGRRQQDIASFHRTTLKHPVSVIALPLINTFAAVTRSTEAAFQASPGLASCLRGNWYLEAALATNLEQRGRRGSQIKCQKLHDSTNPNYVHIHYCTTTPLHADTAARSPSCPLPVGLQLVVAVQPLACCVNRGAELEVEVTGKVLHVGREGERLLLLGVQLQEGPAERHLHS